MKIGVLGSGDVATVLAAGFRKHGHDVAIGTEHPEKLADWSASNAAIRVASFRDAAAFGETLVLAVKGSAALDVMKLAGSDAVDGKPIIDTTNPIAGPPVDGVFPYFTGPNESLMERLQQAYPGARFVKCFNSVGSARMVDPAFEGGTPTMFICGDDDGAKGIVATLTRELGWDVADMGKAIAARAIEPLCMLWCIRGFRENGWTHAFALLT